MTIILVILLGLFLVFCSLRRKVKRQNPIDTIRFNKCLGFCIGDKREFVWSRIQHLDLMSREEKERFKLFSYMQYSKAISVGEDKFNNIEGLQFIFDDEDNLMSITIFFHSKQTDLPTIFNVVKRRLTGHLGNPFINQSEVCRWIKQSAFVNFLFEGDSLYLVVSDMRYWLS